MPGVGGSIRRFDDAAVGLARRGGITALRLALGVVFLWFGILKVADATPVGDLVADIVPLLPDRAAVTVVGAVEILVGIGLITGWAIRLTLGIFFVQMLGTFLVLVAHPSLAFDGGNPLRLTVLGEFVVKNLVLLTAGLVVAATIPRPRPDEGLGEMLAQRAGTEGEITTPRGSG
jgi:putative oxidoreductase